MSPSNDVPKRKPLADVSRDEIAEPRLVTEFAPLQDLDLSVDVDTKNPFPKSAKPARRPSPRTRPDDHDPHEVPSDRLPRTRSRASLKRSASVWSIE